MAIRPITVHVGTYTDGVNGTGRGIYRVDFDAETGALGEPELIVEELNPSFLVWHPMLPVLYAVRETDTGPDRQGAVIAFASSSGHLTRLNEQPSGGASPCYVSVAGSGAWLFVANYHGGGVAAFPLDPDGRIGSSSSVVRHAGSSVHPVRQRKPYAHAIVPAPSASPTPGVSFVLAADLGIDRVIVYRFDEEHGLLTRHDEGTVASAPGAGPRHLAFTPTGDVVLVMNELSSTISAYAWDGARGRLEPLGAPVSTLPDVIGTNSTAEIAVHPDGELLYGANRGHDSLAIFRIGSDRRLTLVGHQSTCGRTPRHFAIDPSGAFLIVANQDSHALVVFRIDRRTGLLTDTGARASVPSPACVRFGPPR